MADQGLGVRSDRAAPGDQPPRGPFPMGTVEGGHVFGEGGEAAHEPAAGVAGHPFAAMEAFDHPLGDPRIELLADQLVGDPVVMPLDVDVIVGLAEEDMSQFGPFPPTPRSSIQSVNTNRKCGPPLHVGLSQRYFTNI